MDRAQIIREPRRVGQPFRVGRPHRHPVVAEVVPVPLLADLHRLALLDVEVPDPHVRVDEGDLFRIGRPLRRAIEARLRHRDLRHVADPGLRREVQRVFARLVGEIGDRLSVRRPGRESLHDRGRVRDDSRIAFFRRDGEDLATRFEECAGRVRRQVSVREPRADVHHASAYFRQISGDAHGNRFQGASLQIEQRQPAELLNDNGVGGAVDRLEVEAGAVLRLFLHQLRARVVREERAGTVTVAEEVDLGADPERVVVGERGQPDRCGVSAAVALPDVEGASHRDVRQADAIRRIGGLPTPWQRQLLGKAAGHLHRVELRDRHVTLAIGRK